MLIDVKENWIQNIMKFIVCFTFSSYVTLNNYLYTQIHQCVLLNRIQVKFFLQNNHSQVQERQVWQ